MNLTLTFDPMTLTLYHILAFTDVHPHSYFGFNPTNSIWDIDKTFVCYGPTDGPTDGPTNRPTDKASYRDADKSRNHKNPNVYSLSIIPKNFSSLYFYIVLVIETLETLEFKSVILYRPAQLELFSRVLRDSTWRYVSMSVRRSISPLVHLWSVCFLAFLAALLPLPTSTQLGQLCIRPCFSSVYLCIFLGWSALHFDQYPEKFQKQKMG